MESEKEGNTSCLYFMSAFYMYVCFEDLIKRPDINIQRKKGLKKQMYYWSKCRWACPQRDGDQWRYLQRERDRGR